MFMIALLYEIFAFLCVYENLIFWYTMYIS